METTTTTETTLDDDDDALFGGGGSGGSSHLMRFAACNRLVVLEKIVPLLGERRSRYLDGEEVVHFNASPAACSKACRRLVVDGKRRRLTRAEVKSIADAEYLRVAIEQRGLPLEAETFSNRRGCYPAAVRSQRRCDGSAESIAGGISVPFRRLVDASSGVGRK